MSTLHIECGGFGVAVETVDGCGSSEWVRTHDTDPRAGYVRAWVAGSALAFALVGPFDGAFNGSVAVKGEAGRLDAGSFDNMSDALRATERMVGGHAGFGVGDKPEG